MTVFVIMHRPTPANPSVVQSLISENLQSMYLPCDEKLILIPTSNSVEQIPSGEAVSCSPSKLITVIRRARSICLL